jgi:hypothetical protein
MSMTLFLRPSANTVDIRWLSKIAAAALPKNFRRSIEIASNNCNQERPPSVGRDLFLAYNQQFGRRGNSISIMPHLNHVAPEIDTSFVIAWRKL